MKFDQFRTMLHIHKHRLDDELEIQPQMNEAIATELAAAQRRTSEAKDRLSKHEADLRTDLWESSEKVTVAQVEAAVIRDRKRQELRKQFIECEEDQTRWQGLYEAWKQRGFAIKTLADLYSSQYFSPDSVQNLRRNRNDSISSQIEAHARMHGDRASTSPAASISDHKSGRRRIADD